ncbi:MAG TPA: FtsX-like permease family protein [Dehalococcoidia bacterium]|nr:FtsX-like permease family protein [Dehalococcoidia bacterium]
MVPIARRNLLAEKLRLAIAVGGVAFAVFLIVTIQSLYQGMRSAAGEFAHEFPADLWVAQQGIADLAHSSSQVPVSVQPEIAALPGVRAAVNAEGRFLRVEIGGRDERAFFMAFQEGPAATAAMRALGYAGPPGPDEVIAHDSIASRGDTLSVAGRDFRVIGTYGGGTPFGSYSFMSYADASGLFAVPGYTSYVVVFLADPGRAGEVADAIRAAHPELDVLTGAQISAYVGKEVDSFIPIITVLLVIAFLVGAAVVSLIVYTATIERARDYAVLKALGASNGRLYLIVLSQSFIVGVAGFVLGVPLAVVVASFVQRLVPEFLTQVNWRPLVVVLGAVALMCFVAAYVPTRRIAQIDPAAVFRA